MAGETDTRSYQDLLNEPRTIDAIRNGFSKMLYKCRFFIHSALLELNTHADVQKRVEQLDQ